MSNQDAKPQNGQEILQRLDDDRFVADRIPHAVNRALDQHKLAGNPVAVCRDGQVMSIPAETHETGADGCAQLRPIRKEELFQDKESLAELCRRHRIQKLSLFGSTLQGANRADSDIDLLVEFEPGATPGLFAFAGIEIEFSQMLGGRTVDLRTRGDLSRYFRDEVAAMAEIQYAAR